MLYFSLFCFIFYSLINLGVVFCDDVSLEIENIGNDVKQSFGEEGFQQQTPASNIILNPIANSLSIRTPAAYLNQLGPQKKHRPTLNQIKYLIQNKNNPAPKVFRAAKANLIGSSGVNGLINLKQIVR